MAETSFLNTSLQLQVDSLNQSMRVENLQEEVDALRRVRDALEYQLQQERENRDLLLASKKKHETSSRKIMLELVDKISALQAANAALEERATGGAGVGGAGGDQAAVAAAEARAAAAEREVQSLRAMGGNQAQIQDLETQVVDLRAANVRLERELTAERHRRVNDAQSRLSSFQHSRTGDAAAELQTWKEKYHRDTEALRSKLVEMKTAQSTNMSTMSMNYDAMSEEIKLLTEEAARLRTEAQQEKAAAAEVQLAFDNLQRKHKRMRKAHSAEVTQLNKKVEALNDRVRELKAAAEAEKAVATDGSGGDTPVPSRFRPSKHATLKENDGSKAPQVRSVRQVASLKAPSLVASSPSTLSTVRQEAATAPSARFAPKQALAGQPRHGRMSLTQKPPSQGVLTSQNAHASATSTTTYVSHKPHAATPMRGAVAMAPSTPQQYYHNGGGGGYPSYNQAYGAFGGGRMGWGQGGASGAYFRF